MLCSQPASFMLSSASVFCFQHRGLMPFSRHSHPLSSTHDLTNDTFCNSKLIYGFIQTQHHHQVLISSSIFEPYSTHCCHHGSLSFVKFISNFFFSHHASLPCRTAGLTLSSCRQPLFIQQLTTHTYPSSILF